MLFLIEYERKEGNLRSMRTFADEAIEEVQDARLQLELDLQRRNVDHEVVLLEAPSAAALLKTHSRYFKSIDAMRGQIDNGANDVQPE
jgi:hypothetical protein